MHENQVGVLADLTIVTFRSRSCSPIVISSMSNTYMHACIHTYVCVYLCMYVYFYTHTCICIMHLFVYLFIY